MKSYSLVSEEQLFEQIQNDDRKAFAELFNRYWRKAFVSAYSKLQEREATQEIVQELFIALWDKRATLSIHNFAAYLQTSIRNKCINYIQSKIVEKKHWDYYKGFIPLADETTERRVRYNELMEAINKGMDGLPQKTKMVFQLNRMEGRSIPEIADVLNLSEKAIEYHLTRSLKHLRVHLRDYMLFAFIYLVNK